MTDEQLGALCQEIPPYLKLTLPDFFMMLVLMGACFIFGLVQGMKSIEGDYPEDDDGIR